MSKRAAIYVRVSTDKQSESVENQRNSLRQVAERRGWEVVEVYTDEGISGAKGRDKRPALGGEPRPEERSRSQATSLSRNKLGLTLRHAVGLISTWNPRL